MIDRSVSVIFVALVLGLLFVVERVAAIRPRTRPLLGRLLVNAGISALAFGVSALMVRPAALSALQWASERPFGLVHMVAMPVAAQFTLAVLLLDLTFYWWHVANHRVGLLWRFHNVHHIDPDLDVTTAFRFHFGEIAFSTVFRVLQVSAIGPSLWVFSVYEIVFQANTLFQHSNVRLPIRLERLLNLVLVTPRMHGIHHSQVRDETDSNYSVVFSWWDRLHRTLGLNIPQSEVVVGVPAYSRPEDNRFWNAFLLPFGHQRDYWRREDGRLVQRDPAALSDKPSSLAE